MDNVNSLTHYTKNFSNLLSILQNGLKYSTPPKKEILPLRGFSNNVYSAGITYYIQPVAVCFCDIPFKNIRGHLKNYGQYGIGLSKQWCMNQGVTPIRYFHSNTPDLQDDSFMSALTFVKADSQGISSLRMIIEELNIKGVINNFTLNDCDKLSFEVKQILEMYEREYKKAMSYVTTQVNYLRTCEFYHEHEWRAIQPKNKVDFLKFPMEEITYLIVSNENEKKEILKLNIIGIKDKIILSSDLVSRE